ncbi:Protein kinase-like domain protein [Niveomyces insectorum RCEF 264]|uniref:EKC/KEOPS complex subunit BUD32 n=1 Tax=Niveomyces insectorum RCEF 264 TaxID=1081102 RepID=A0A167WUV3_9HYPO|nr:Protein kinase-like domain protein [Niveomyces insectorum RCEF 264]
MNGIAPNNPGSIISMGASCFVSYADEATVLKGYEIWVNGRRKSYYERDCEDALSREEVVYRHLGQHPQILRCFGREEVAPGIHSLRLELAPLGNVRQYIRQHSESHVPMRTRLQMCVDISGGLSYIHSKKIQHCDLSCRNFLLFPKLRVKIGDFGGAMIEGHNFRPNVCEESHYELPCRGRKFNERPPIKRELFALGCAIYEVVAWKKPFGELEDEEVEARYDREEFPSLLGIKASHVIWNCWNERYDSAEQVMDALMECMSKKYSENT